MNLDWGNAENAIAAAVAAISGLPVGKIYWEGQDVDRPAMPYLSLWRDAEECLAPNPEKRVSLNPAGYKGAAAGADTITPTLDPATPQASVAVGHLASWGGIGTTGTCVIGSGPSAETVSFVVGSTGLALVPWPAKAHAAGSAVARNTVIGTELLIDYSAPSEFHLRIQAFTSGVKGSSSAPALLSAVHNGFDVESVRDTLRAAGLVVIERGIVQNLSALVEVKTEGRASLDIRFRFADGAQEITTFIESVKATPILDGTTGQPITAP